MLEINDDNIEVTRGNYMAITLTTKNPVDRTAYVFQIGDVVRFKVFERKNVDNVFLEKDFIINETSEEVVIELTADEMKIGDRTKSRYLKNSNDNRI